MTHPDPKPPASLDNRYEIEREVGAGGMATVYLARDVRHGRKVAIKVLRPDLGAVLGGERFLAEIRVTANLQHPNIVPLFDSGETEGWLFYVMPFIQGETLADRIEREGPLPIDEAIRIAREVADALSYAHSFGIIHRDVKPGNILLAGGHALVADFGIARAISAARADRVTRTGMAVGTPAYMSPEQSSADAQLDPRSDQFSLACVLFEMLAGEPPTAASRASSLRVARPAVPESVNRAVRRALATAPADRFVTVVAFAEALAGPAEEVDARSVAVLPFINMSTDSDNEYFADGITEDVIAQLAKIRSLKVVSRTSVMPFKKREQGLREIAAQLRVATLLEGSVRRAGDRVRIVAQLIRAATDEHLWAETFDRQLTDIFAIQSEVALRIAEALQAELTADERARVGREPTTNVRAYQLYLRGRHALIQYSDESMRQAIGYFESAIGLDPQFALAYSGIAMAWTEMGEIGAVSPDDAYPRARDAARRALEIDPELADAHTTAAFCKLVYEFDWAGAEVEFKRAVQLSPNSADAWDLYGRLCSALLRFDDAIEMQRRAYELDPLAHPADVANAYLRAGRVDEALAASERAMQLSGNYLPRAHATFAWACLAKGRIAEGLAALERAVAVHPEDTLWLGQLGAAYARHGREAEARAILARMLEWSKSRYVAPNHLAYVYTGLGELDRAMDCLEQSFERRAGATYSIKGSFLFYPLRDHPRFQALLRKMNLG